MKTQIKANSLHLKKDGDKLTIEAKFNPSHEKGSCQVAGDIDENGNMGDFYCIGSGCDNCKLHSKEEEGGTSYWCTCESKD